MSHVSPHVQIPASRSSWAFYVQDSAEYVAAAENLDFAINEAFYNASTGAYIDLLQTHLVMPLASGVVPTTRETAVVTSLEAAVAATGGHVDTGLTGTYVYQIYGRDVGEQAVGA